ncbi:MULTISPECIES: hypothetical protein [Aerococcus]|uniref:Uncharacterized protein n=1 Tax=Aerococcus tenax TaxID=3078812 RepID=A0A5N1BLB4_9LACT|nr:hypothetical protein [Aerococcus urinae]KAA9241008.1 hypothetical protein F6I34_03570 [Aerococcus urinae]MDK6370487.1 hypothetical protein [Aerococcus urinae]MDK6596841.1 hypothetical protein [Aerococcus urinae]MDK7302304.1 hypothetical protein [Aerococcus urinae]MDK7800743.1 hypothetical protein [Aerococcus urinae]
MSYFQLTIKKFFLKDGSIDLYAFLFGLLFLFTFAFMQLPDWLTILASTLLASSVFRYITTDELFHEEIVNLSTPGQVIDYTISKNLFTILFELILLFIVFLLLSFLKVFGFYPQAIVDKGYLLVQLLCVLGTENIILLFFNKPVKSYQKGIRRNGKEDIVTGIESFKSLLPSIAINILFTCLCFFFRGDLGLYPALGYYVFGVVIFIFLSL